MEGRKSRSFNLRALCNSPLASNAAFGFILMILEKLAEVEFECPCSPTWNRVFSSAFFIIPAVMSFILMLIITECRCDTWCRKTVYSFVPVIVWLTLVFFDGQYFACAMTDWEGKFVLLDNTPLQRWCEPKETATSQDRALKSHQFFALSQTIGIILLVFICVGLVVYLIGENCQRKETTADAEELMEYFSEAEEVEGATQGACPDNTKT